MILSLLPECHTWRGHYWRAYLYLKSVLLTLLKHCASSLGKLHAVSALRPPEIPGPGPRPAPLARPPPPPPTHSSLLSRFQPSPASPSVPSILPSIHPSSGVLVPRSFSSSLLAIVRPPALPPSLFLSHPLSVVLSCATDCHRAG